VVIEQVGERWHRFVTGGSPGELDGLFADDVDLYSPIVHTPQRGRDITTTYVRAAAEALFGDGGSGAFHYTKQVLAGDVAVLEFETTVHGKYVNGVNILRCDKEARIVELRVMIRPLQAVNAVHESMSAMLASMEVVADSPLAAVWEQGNAQEPRCKTEKRGST
jgi:hypothetical protein